MGKKGRVVRSKSRPDTRKYAGKTEEEWKEWGFRLGKDLDQGGREFADAMDDFGEKIREQRFEEKIERFGRRMEHKGREWERHWFRTFGFIGPLIGSIVSLICLLFCVFVLNLINIPVQSGFVSTVSGFVLTNIYLFFTMSLLLGYGRYLYRRYPVFRIVQPLLTTVSVVFGFWVAASVLALLGVESGNSVITTMANLFLSNLVAIFTVFLVLAYASALFKMTVEEEFCK